MQLADQMVNAVQAVCCKQSADAEHNVQQADHLVIASLRQQATNTTGRMRWTGT